MVQQSAGIAAGKKSEPDLPSAVPHESVSFRQACAVWVRVALLSFGGPTGQIAVMHRILVDEKRWISEFRFLHALNYCMLLPGPEAQQLATYIGWLMHGVWGGLVAGALFVLPGFLSILALSILYASYQQTDLIQALFFGLKAAVMAVVAEAVIRIGKRALKNEVMIGLAALAFVAIFCFGVPFPVIILTAAAIGFLGGRLWEEKFYVVRPHVPRADAVAVHVPFADALAERAPPRPPALRSFRVALFWLALWIVPLLVLVPLLGWDNVFVREGLFFSKAALMTFGGAYSVLAYVAQQAVETYGWLTSSEMLDGLGMAETTPGPLIQVVQFVAFLGAYRAPSGLTPLAAGVFASVLATWVTFIPSFLYIFVGAPYIEGLRGNKSLTTALSAITAAVVGVVLNLAVWFSLHTLFGTVHEDRRFWPLQLLVPEWRTVNLPALVIAVGAFIALFRYHADLILTLAVSMLLGFGAWQIWLK